MATSSIGCGWAKCRRATKAGCASAWTWSDGSRSSPPPDVSGASARADVAEMKVECAGAAVVEILFQRRTHRAESDVVPGDLGFGEEPGFERFDAGLKVEIEQPGAEHEVHLIDMRQVVQGIQAAHFDARAGFFPGFARRAFERGFAVFHEAGRQGPQAVSGFDGTPAQQHLVLPFGNAADDHLGVLVMDGAAFGADMTRQVVSAWHAQHHGAATFTAKVHAASNSVCVQARYQNPPTSIKGETGCRPPERLSFKALLLF